MCAKENNHYGYYAASIISPGNLRKNGPHYSGPPGRYGAADEHVIAVRQIVGRVIISSGNGYLLFLFRVCSGATAVVSGYFCAIWRKLGKWLFIRKRDTKRTLLI